MKQRHVSLRPLSLDISLMEMEDSIDYSNANVSKLEGEAQASKGPIGRPLGTINNFQKK